MDKEIWKDILGYEGLYQASNLGRIKRLEGKVETKNKYGKMLKTVRERILKQSNSTSGHKMVELFKNGIGKMCWVHRLVWEAFNYHIPEGMHINHIDENPSNNVLSNLNLMTPKENANWGTRNERISNSNINGKCSKSILQFDLNGNFIKEWASFMEIKRQLGFSTGNIWRCCNGKLKYSNGYIWKYTC